MLRGEIQPTGSQGQLYIQDVSVAADRYLARFHLGVCPQFDAMDTLSVREHLAFYARIRGVADVSGAVEAMIRSVGLQPFADRMADKLSGGNKRKLSLAMALIGNPEVVLLDEPSSGMDPLAKRNMWRTLAKFRHGRSILLTTHSMEEADALASRVGVISRRLLDIGTTAHLRQKHGHGFHVHVVMASAPHSTQEEMAGLQGWIEAHVPGARLEGLPYHGQLRYVVPANGPPAASEKGTDETDGISSVPSGNREPNGELNGAAVSGQSEGPRSVGSLFMLLEENKKAQGIEFYSVSPATFDEVFLKVINRHNVGEEEITAAPRWTLRQLFPRLFSFIPSGIS
jgi:ATP-binding cassette subfamily A (ABC1) protein 3